MKQPRTFTWYDCPKPTNRIVDGIRTDGKCDQCKAVVHLIELSAYQNEVERNSRIEAVAFNRFEENEKLRALVAKADEIIMRQFQDEWERQKTEAGL